MNTAKQLTSTNVLTNKDHMVTEANEAIRRIRIKRNISSSNILGFFFSSSKGVTLRNILRLSREYQRLVNINSFDSGRGVRATVRTPLYICTDYSQK